MNEILRAIDPELYSLTNRRRAAREAVRPAAGNGGMSSEDQQGIVGKLRDGSIGTLAAVGNILDLPGSMVRDTLAGSNPFDQLLPWNWTSSTNRTSGRDLARQFGLAKQRDTGANFVGGLGAEIALDPLTYLTFGASALGKAGQAAKAAGLMDNLASVAARKAGKAVGDVGKREARVGTTLGDFLKFGDTATSAKAREVIDSGVNATEPVGGLLGLNRPFGASRRAIGNGDRVTSIARAMDTAGSTVQRAKVPGTDFAPVDSLARLFDVKLGGAKTKLGQAIGSKLFRDKELAMVGPRSDAARRATQLNDIGFTSEREGDFLRSLTEGVLQPNQLPPNLQGPLGNIAKEMRADNINIRNEAEMLGIPVDELNDDYVDYAARFLTESSKHRGGRDRRMFGTGDPSSRARLDHLRNVPGGTEYLKTVFKDQELNDLIDTPTSTVDDVAKFIGQKFGSQISDDYKVFDPATGQWNQTTGRHKAIAQQLARTSRETRDAGIFGNHPILDHQARQVAHSQSKVTVEGLADALSQPGVLNPANATIQNSKDRVSLRGLIGELGLKVGDDTKGFGQFLKGKTGATGTVDELVDQTVSREHADDLRRIMKMISGPEEAGDIVKAIDSVTNFGKGMWTSVWPAFHVRNTLSGQVHNSLLGMWSRSSVVDANALLQGKVVKGASGIPAVKAEIARRGVAATDEEATKILGEMVYSHNVLGKFDARATDVAGQASDMASGTLADMLTGIKRPGEKSFSPARTARKAVGVEPGTGLNPFDVRGVGGRLESGFGPAAAGEEIGHYAEGLNRISPFINQLRKGVDPSEAANKVGVAQVQYSNRNFTPFEQQAMKRLFPFYSFTSRVTPQIVKQIMEQPGGRLGAAVRAQRNAQDSGDLAPDYVRESASIPLGGVLGKVPEGTDRYLAGFGLMHEDPFSFGPGPRAAGVEALSRMNPFIKAPLEWMVGESFFQKGPDGGRELDDMDPLLGRIYANVTGQQDAPRTPVWLEQAVSNSPAARALSTVRQLTDTRKSIPAKLLNTLTGVRITDVSPGSKDAIVRGLLNREMKDTGAKAFERIYYSKDDLANMSPEEQANATNLQALANLLAELAKQRATQKQ